MRRQLPSAAQAQGILWGFAAGRKSCPGKKQAARAIPQKQQQIPEGNDSRKSKGANKPVRSNLGGEAGGRVLQDKTAKLAAGYAS